MARIIEGDLGEAGGTEFPEGNPVPGLSPSVIPPPRMYSYGTGHRIQDPKTQEYRNSVLYRNKICFVNELHIRSPNIGER